MVCQASALQLASHVQTQIRLNAQSYINKNMADVPPTELKALRLPSFQKKGKHVHACSQHVRTLHIIIVSYVTLRDNRCECEGVVSERAGE